MKINWKQLLGVAIKAALKSNPKTAPIADEVAAVAVEAEEIFKPSTPEEKTGAKKLAHVLVAAKELAQASDELRGSTDEVPGHISNALTAAVAAANEVKKAIEEPAIGT